MDFPEHLRLNKPERRRELIQALYESHHGKHSSKYSRAVDGEKKVRFFQQRLAKLKASRSLNGIDLGCRGGLIAKELTDYATWVGCDLDRHAIDLAKQNGVPCVESDISVSLDFKDSSFDIVTMTEVMEHLPYPEITVREVHRILNKEKGIFLGSVPLEYNIHRRWRVFRGKRLEHDPTHLHHFSFNELNELLKTYFKEVVYQPLRGLPAKYPFLTFMPYNDWVRDIAWVASGPT